MSKKNGDEAPEGAGKPKFRKVVSKPRASSPAEAGQGKKSRANEHIGRVQSLSVKTDGSARHVEFVLRGRGGARRTFSLPGSDALSGGIMVNALLAAYASDSKIAVRTASGSGDSGMVSELTIGRKLGKDSDQPPTSVP